ncbi:hypothetical protein M408DRAFT_119541 [Serendipita vermifera MAFF 305830]|uniref:Protein kinase domain-containing protein n=1 Tax=Serendipita vermifera MAFF 305830 TaxID=933852 RepID=A0A0C3BAP0_SERVB|nr:hypothetical protein M408DRAFT_119541 [Serendipita vermifera MAFF 305830]
MNHGQVRYGNAYSPYPYGNPNSHNLNASTTSISSLASTSSKLLGLFKSSKDKDKAPPVPEKDYPYLGGRNALPSTSSISITLSDAGTTASSNHSGSVAGKARDRAAGLFKMGNKKSKKNKERDLQAQQTSISVPWNVKHEMHIDDGLKGFPPEWENSLLQLGYTPEEIQEMVAQKQRQRGPSMSINGPSAGGSSSKPSSHHTNPSTSSSQYRYPTPPQQYVPPVPQASSSAYQPLTLQTDISSTFGDLEQYQTQSKTNSPATRAPLRNPIHRSDSPANSIRSNGTNNQRERASPVPSLTREREPVFQPSNLSTSSHGPMQARKPVAPVRPAPPPPLFSEASISTSKANAYKPPRVIAVNGDEDSDDENLPLGDLVSSNKESQQTARALANHKPAGSVGTTASQNKGTRKDSEEQDAEDDTPTTASQNHTGAPGSSSTNLLPPKISMDAPPRLSLSTLTIPRISLSLGSLDLGLGLDSDEKPKEKGSGGKDRGESQTIEWSESLFAALPSATAFDGFRTSVIRKGDSSGRGSPASNYNSPIGSTGARASPGTLGQSPATAVSRGASPLTGSTFGFGSPIQSREPSPTTAGTGVTLVAPSSSRSHMLSSPQELSPAGRSSAGQSPMDDTRSTQAGNSPLLTPSPVRDLARDSVSSYATERASMSSFGETEFGEGHEDEDGMGEAVVVTRATAVKLARAPSMALQRSFDVLSGANAQASTTQATGQYRGVMGQASAQVVNVRPRGESDAKMPPYAALQAQRLLYQNSGFDDDDDDDSDEDSDEDDVEDEDDEDEDPESRNTIRLGDADAGRLMNAVMKSGGVLDAQQQKDLGSSAAFGGVNDRRPLSTATIRKEERPISTDTIQGVKISRDDEIHPEERPAVEEAEQDDEDSSALDDWLEANDSEDPDPSSPAIEESVVAASPGNDSVVSDYDDTDHPLLDAYTTEDAGGDYGDRSPDSLYEAEDGESSLGPQSARSYDQESPSSENSIQDSPLAPIVPGRTRGLSKSSQSSAHARTPGTGSGSGSSAGAGSYNPHRSSMVYTPTAVAKQLSVQQKDILKSLLGYIRSGDPSSIYGDLQQVAEGESGGIYAARVLNAKSSSVRVAIKKVRVEDETRPKIDTLKREMGLFSRIRHENILSYGEMRLSLDGDVELWIRMELMERSLADLLGLIPEGLALEERHVSRFAKDIASGLAYLEKLFIAHRDIRSDNVLVSGNDGCAKLGAQNSFPLRFDTDFF